MTFPIAARRLLRRLVPLAAGFVLAGCSSVVNSHTQKQEMVAEYLAGDNDATLDEIEYKLRDPAWYNTSVVDTGDELMWRLEAGSMNFHVGDFEESLNQFKIAEELIENGNWCSYQRDNTPDFSL